MYFEVEENPNCSENISMRFKELGAARAVIQVRTSDRPQGSEMCWVTGWRDDSAKPVCPAYAQKVEDSGLGMAYLIYGGNWGIRLRPVGMEEEWDLESPNQWGEPFLLLGSPRNLIYVNSDPE